MADINVAEERYNIFESGCFWDLALIFGFSNAYDGDSFEVASAPEINRSGTLSTSLHMDLSWTTIHFDEDELATSRNKESSSPIFFSRDLSFDHDSTDDESLCSYGTTVDLSFNEEFPSGEELWSVEVMRESTFNSEDQSPDWLVMGSILDDSSIVCTPEPTSLSKAHVTVPDSLKFPCITSTPDCELASATRKRNETNHIEQLKTALNFPELARTLEFS